MLNLLQRARLAIQSRFEGRAGKSEKFVENFVLPDMVEKGFGFGRAAVGAALVKRRVKTFEDIANLPAADIEAISNARGVGPKVMRGFKTYLAKIGRLPDADEPVETVIVDSAAPPATDKASDTASG